MPDANVIEDFLGEEVVDPEGVPVGTFACYWERDVKKALLLGVNIPERSGHTHIVPARSARFNERQGYVQVAFSRKQIMQAPCLKCEREIDDDFEEKVWRFYGLPVPLPGLGEPMARKAKAIRQQLRRIVHCAPEKAGTTKSVSGSCNTRAAAATASQSLCQPGSNGLNRERDKKPVFKSRGD